MREHWIVLRETVIVVNGGNAKTLSKGTKGILQDLRYGQATLLVDGVACPGIPAQSMEEAADQ